MTAVAANGSQAPVLIRAYVWEWPVRLAHWLVVFSLAVLVPTGLYMGHPYLASPGPSEGRFVMGTVKVVHFYAAIVFTLAVLARIFWMFLGNRYASWKEFIPVAGERRRGILSMLSFYLFVRRDPPTFIGHNPLAGATYSLVFLVYLLMSATGFALYSVSAPVDSHMRAFHVLLPYFGGAQGARWIHHVGMWLLLGFAVHHVYSAVMMAMVEKKGTLESIFSGYKFFTRADLKTSPSTAGRQGDGA
jgi:Ni/Fe-hydrogenase 1 B-type cytochrome subunit